ncbi:hypothetical protein COLO4_06435 [Corchorus olitorius]|uniref:Uncharacterized protein n=1 Tax=Corchorus olitorius TaxID=93759 RepID=A0A1R3KNA0_9ROSI|nr:hypothetical protein COLO4_06435 [Corchorus olitorius]
MPTRHRKKKKSKGVKKARRNVLLRDRSVRLSLSENESPARLSSFFQRMIPCTVEYGKVRESFCKSRQQPTLYFSI